MSSLILKNRPWSPSLFLGYGNCVFCKITTIKSIKQAKKRLKIARKRTMLIFLSIFDAMYTIKGW